MGECEKCNEHLMVIKELGNNTGAINKWDKRAWQGIVLLFCILLTNLLAVGSTAYFAMSKRSETVQVRYEAPRSPWSTYPGVTRVTPPIKGDN